MNIIQSQKIGLCVAGTKSRQGGFTPFVIAGILAGGEAGSMDRVTLVAEKPAYIIKHTPEYILYLLIDRKVKPCDRDTYGVLSIALTIARDMRLADGKSPYALLKEVYDKFRSDYMEPYMEPDGTDGDRFINKDMNPADFASIMEQYPVEKHSWDKYVAMNPLGLAGTLCVPQDKMEDLFRDSQYPEFANFKEIEIGTCCQTTIGLENIEIPRPVVYSIELNGKLITPTVSRPADKFDTAGVLNNTTDVEYEHMSFSLGDLLDAPDHRLESGKSSAVLDRDRKLIRCTIDETPLIYLLEYEILEGTDEEQKQLVDWISSGKVQLVFGSKSAEFPSSSLLNPKQASIPASWAHEKVSYRTNDLKLTFKLGVKSTVNDEEKYVKVTITIIPKTVDSFLTYSLGYEILGGTKKEQKQLANWILDGSVKLTFGGQSAEFFSDSKASIPASWVQKEVRYRTYQKLTAFDLSLKSIVDDEKKHVQVIITITPKAVDYSLEYEVIGGTKKQQRQLVDWISNGTVLLTFGGKSADFLSNPKQVSIPASCVHQEASYRIYQDFTTFDLSLKSIVDDGKKHVKVTITITSKKESSNKAKKLAILMGVCCFVGMCIGAGIVGGFWHFWGAEKSTAEDSDQTAKGQGLTHDDSIQIAIEMIKTVPFDQIISFDEAKKLETLRPLREAIEEKPTTQIGEDIESQGAGSGAAEEHAQAQKDAQERTKEQMRQKILQLVNDRDWDSCKNELRSWIDKGYITEQESNAITAVLYVEIQNSQYKNISPQALKKFKQEIQNENFKSLDDVVCFNKNIIMKFIENPDSQKRR